MGKLVILKLYNGSLETGFKVTLQIGEDGEHPFMQEIGELPPAPELYQIHQYWRFLYHHFLEFPQRELKQKSVLNYSYIDRNELNNIADKLSISLNEWLNSQEFRIIKEKLLTELKFSEEIRIIIQVKDILSKRIPWHLWEILDNYRNAELAIGELTYRRTLRSSSNIVSNKIRILAVIGNNKGIDIQKDRELLECLSDNTETLFLVEPSLTELNHCLWDKKGWNILFFAGHSYSQDNGETGSICINQNETLKINELKNSLKASSELGLQIAIFNSCDGLGLAQSLTDLQIPQVIVMRERISDLVAHEFLKQFLKEFSEGKSLYLSLREAREKLEGLQNDFPCASWLPILFQNTAELPPTWQQLSPLSFLTQQRARNKYLKIWQKSVKKWNKWRDKNPECVPEFKKINLSKTNLQNNNLRLANFNRADFSGADFSGANLSKANFSSAILQDTNLSIFRYINNLLPALTKHISLLISIGIGIGIGIGIEFSYKSNHYKATNQPSRITYNMNHFTRTEYERLKIGMKLVEVQAILGRGTEIKRSTKNITLMWKNPDNSKIAVTFKDNKLIIKEQRGL